MWIKGILWDTLGHTVGHTGTHWDTLGHTVGHTVTHCGTHCDKEFFSFGRRLQVLKANTTKGQGDEWIGAHDVKYRKSIKS